MTATLWVSVLLGAGGTIGGLLTAFSRISDWRRNKEKKEGEIKLDQASYDEIATRAASINAEDFRKAGEFWQSQFDAVKAENKEIREELRIEQLFRKRITKYIRNHEPWDELAEARLIAAKIEMPPRPTLTFDETDDE